ncbi:hypothetical protein BAUCODRAFT_125747 [Baudoinia panamericana UAMH 10762]|uniref:Uncharacterized protein n=1 Tax=Baudoinia panamericana (strain UAMH 10762) TaxID=717646 RepID=M2M8P2_BAUPA|nr:uncharacterized protein BAUCODRAFT_125747 [Baudoinia panamericana UAMH 10762]EMC92771.1 hypothetical protein BAUCODRAFT_125747 [Baudoinia panamericana UAMH 10762]
MSLPPGTDIDIRLGHSRRRSTQLPPSQHDHVHRRLPRLFSGHIPGSNEDGGDESSDDGSQSEAIELRDNFLGRVHSYSKLMHNHTRLQLESPTGGTLPSYTKTMHAFTLNQLNHHRVTTTTKSLTASPWLGSESRQSALPSNVCLCLSKLSLGEVPRGPSNTPEHGLKSFEGLMVNRRSVTEPAPRGFAVVVQTRDFALV